jgi:hypothetical protein
MNEDRPQEYTPLLGDALPRWTPEDGTDFEVGEWILSVLSADVSAAIDREEKATPANQETLRQLRAQSAQLAQERRRMMDGGAAAVARVIAEYGPRARQRHREGR